MPVTKIRSKWVAGLLEFFGVTTGETVLKITESGIEANVTGNVTGNVAGMLTGGIVGGAALTKADNYALGAADKAKVALSIILSAGSKTITAGLAAGQVMFIHNAGDTNAFTLKNVSGDTGTEIAAGKIVLIIGSATANASTIIALN
jgi:hypothetical protein